ncbi:MAG: protein phosphatase 2C domain-containing protein [Phycisphaeraceae bacterium]|nr:protein phosphatase 2C domain-containing protein [Phycisphaeraceae bacterium]MCB9848078.1 protein phosphatase 2C domain-containing protein [Phycisphaeraceae bacterium]
MSSEATILLESVLLTEEVCAAPALIRCPVGEAVFCSVRSPAKTTVNEDAVLITALGEESLLLAVADGCGGMPAGHAAAARAIDALHETVLEMDPEPTIESFTLAMLAGFDAANRAVLETRAGSATTLLGACVVRGVVRVLNVGDSMALVVGQRGRERYSAIAHSLTGYAVESGIMTEHEAIHHDDRYIVLNVVGDESMRVDVGPPIALRPRDTVLLASDGLCDNLYAPEIIAGVRSGPLLERVEAMTALSRARMVEEEHGVPGHPDDLSLIAYRPAVSGGGQR